MFDFVKKLLACALTLICLLCWSEVSYPITANAANVQEKNQNTAVFQAGEGGQWMLNLWFQLDQQNNGAHFEQWKGNNGLHLGQRIGSANDQLALTYFIFQIADILDADENTIIDKLRNGSTPAEIAKSYNVDESTLLKKLTDLIHDEIDDAAVNGTITATQVTVIESKIAECLKQVVAGKLNGSIKSDVLDAPDDLEATAESNSEIVLEWNYVNGATSYYIFRSKSKSGTYAKINTVSATSYTDNNLTGNTSYYYKVQAYSSKGTGTYSSVAYATTFGNSVSNTDTPAKLTATAGSGGKIILDWNAASDATSYYVYRSTSYSGIYVKIDTVLTTGYIDNDLTNNTIYYYKVKIHNSTGTHGFSSAVSAMAGALVPPGGLEATAVSRSEIALEWNYVSGATSYYIYRTTSNSGAYTKIGTVTATNYTDKGLTNNATCYYKVQAHNSTYTSKSSSVAYAAVNNNTFNDLAAPGNLSAAAENDSEISLKWNSVSGATSYYIYRSTSSSGIYVKIDAVKTTSYKDKYLSDNSTYYYRVKARSNSAVGKYSSIVKAATEDGDLAVPDGLTAAVSGSSIILDWNPVVGATSYYVYRATSYSGTYSKIVAATATSHIDSGLPANTTYYYKVKAYGSSDTSEYSSIVNAATKANTLTAPINFSASAISSSIISLYWDSVKDATLYYVYRSVSYSGTYTLTGTTSVVNYVDSGLTANVTYYYVVKAYNGSYTSDSSLIVNATTTSSSSGDLDEPDDLTATAKSSSKISLDWDSVSNATSYYVYRSTSKSGSYSKIDTVTASSFTDTGLSDDETYYYKVKAHNSSDTSDYSSIAHATTGDDSDDSDDSDSDLDAPDDLTATAESSSEISLDWDSVSDATSYYVYRSTSSSGSYSKIDTVTSSSYTDTGLSEDTTYYYKVKAHNSSDTSEYSSIDSATTDDDSDSDLDSPDDLTATAKSSSKISLDWDSVSGATSYYVYRATSKAGTYSKIDTVTSSSYSDTGLSDDTTYYYKVKAHNSSDTSEYSSVAHATTD